MKIAPEKAIIPREKLTGYLLIFRPESDKSQFLAKGGFTLENPNELEDAIRALIVENEAVHDLSNEFGDYYRVEGTLKGINAIHLGVVTVWIMRSGDNGFRFVTLKPKRG